MRTGGHVHAPHRRVLVVDELLTRIRDLIGG
jgi:hypothetical protein